MSILEYCSVVIGVKLNLIMQRFCVNKIEYVEGTDRENIINTS